MGRVFVAGSINMDVVATADRHPRSARPSPARGAVFSRRQGRQPGGRGGEARRATTLIGRLGKDAFGQRSAGVSRRARRRPGFVQGHAEAHTGTAIITIANADNTIVVVPGANALVSAADVAAPVACQRRRRGQPVRDSAARDQRFFKRARAAGATTILNPAPAMPFGRELLDLVDILILNETELGFLTRTELRDTDDPRASSRRRDRCRPARTRSSASRWASAACWRWSAASPR
jgi:ribokinase